MTFVFFYFVFLVILSLAVQLALPVIATAMVLRALARTMAFHRRLGDLEGRLAARTVD